MPLRIVHVGLGGWGQDWEANALPRATGIEPVAWVDADAATLAAARRRLALPPDRCFPSLAAALGVVEAEAVLVTTPVDAHVPVAIEAIEQGKHVLVEKPFAPSVAEARRAVEIAAARSVVLMVSQNYRFFPAPRVVAALIAGGELGPVGAATVDFRRNVTAASGSPRHLALAHPLLADMAIHHFDLMRMILGAEPQLMSCQTWNPPWSPFAADAAATATVVFDGGTVVSWRGSWVSPGAKTAWGGEWRVECAQGEIDWTSRDDPADTSSDRVSVRPPGGKLCKRTLPPMAPYGRAGALTAFADAIERGTEPETSGRHNLMSLALVEAAVASAKSGRTVPVLPQSGAGQS